MISKSFEKITVVTTIAVDKAAVGADSGNCTKLFETTTTSTFGSNPSCTWSADAKTLTVTLGQGATVKKGSSLRFNNENMLFKTGETDCTNNKQVLNKPCSVEEPTDFPQIVLYAPADYSPKCNQLVLDASTSTGFFGRTPEYKWKITSSSNYNFA